MSILGGIDLTTLADTPELRYTLEAIAEEARNEFVTIMDPGPKRTGRQYRVPGTGIYSRKRKGKKRRRLKAGTGVYYTASAPGEPPAKATGQYIASFQVNPPVRVGTRVVAGVSNSRRTESGHFLMPILEFGRLDGKIKPRPHIRPVLDKLAKKYGGRVVME